METQAWFHLYVSGFFMSQAPTTLRSFAVQASSWTSILFSTSIVPHALSFHYCKLLMSLCGRHTLYKVTDPNGTFTAGYSAAEGGVVEASVET